MKSNKCHGCGLVNFSAAESCKRCGAPLASAPWHFAAGGEGREPARRMNPFASKPVLILGAVALFVVAAAVSVWSSWAQANAPFAAMLLSSREFAQPVTVKVNQTALPEGRELFGRRAAPEAYALATLGLLDVRTREYLVEVKPTNYRYHPEIDYEMGLAERPKSVYVTKRTVDIALTEKGREAAAGWEVTTRSAVTSDVSWWRVPVGRRELLKVESARRGEPDPHGNEMMCVYFKWRWRPNEIGAAFDRSGAGRHLLPDEARDSPLARLDSAAVYDGVAWFVRGADGGWEPAGVYCNVTHDRLTGERIGIADIDWP